MDIRLYPDFDTKWQNLDCKTILRFEVGNVAYEVMRYKSYICLNIEGKITFYPKITGDYSIKIAEILGFHALMPKRNTDQLETPPPAYYFVPFYIDQKRSWTLAWEGFASLTQYDKWKSPIISYHIGLLTKEHFEIELQKSIKKQEKSEIDKSIEKLKSTLEVVSQYISEPVSTIDKSKLNDMTTEIREDLRKLSDFQEKTLDEYTMIEGEKSFLNHQKIISERIILNLEKDYQFSVEHFANDQISCPLCGTHHENSIVNRASILTDKDQAEMQLNEITRALAVSEEKLVTVRGNLERTRMDIDNIHSKYLLETDNQKISLNDIIENIAGNSIRDGVEKTKDEKTILSKSLADEIKELNIEQKNLLSQEQKDAINDLFVKTFTSYIEALDAEDINTSLVTTPMDYTKIIKEGGAAEGSRGILAYYLTIHTMIEKSGNDVLAPLLIDTPNQQEQSGSNYDKILKLIKSKISSSSQIILCALQNEKLDDLKEDANIIHLDKNQLLIGSKYEAIKKDFDLYKLTGIE